jgi:hypothetical protein
LRDDDHPRFDIFRKVCDSDRREESVLCQQRPTATTLHHSMQAFPTSVRFEEDYQELMNPGQTHIDDGKRARLN